MIVASIPPRAKCSDCDHVYEIATIADPQQEAREEWVRENVQRSSSDAEQPRKSKAKRTAAPGKRHRRDNGPQELEVSVCAEPDPNDIGATTLYHEEILTAGTAGMIEAHRRAAALSLKLGEEIEAKWFLKTKWLGQLAATHALRARAALAWRPRFLAAMALTRSYIIACRASNITYMTYVLHRDRDEVFAAQVKEAEEHATQMLHDACWKSALEGDLEPVYWQGIKVGHIRKYSDKLRIELLRAHRPDKFKTPGNANINVNTHNNVFVLTEEKRAELMAQRQRALTAMRAEGQPKLITAS